MNHFPIHDLHTAPEATSASLTQLNNKMHFIPNVFAAVAESPTTLDALLNLNEAFSQSSFSPQQQQIILLAASVENSSAYCVAGHSAFAHSLDLPNKTIASLRNGQTIESQNDQTLIETVEKLIQSRGQISAEDIQQFLAAGFNQAQFLELVIGICLKTMTNYISNSLSLKLDTAFEAYQWTALHLNANNQ